MKAWPHALGLNFLKKSSIPKSKQKDWILMFHFYAGTGHGLQALLAYLQMSCLFPLCRCFFPLFSCFVPRCRWLLPFCSCFLSLCRCHLSPCSCFLPLCSCFLPLSMCFLLCRGFSWFLDGMGWVHCALSFVLPLTKQEQSKNELATGD